MTMTRLAMGQSPLDVQHQMGYIQVLCAQLGIDTRKKAQKVLDKYISQEIQENNHAADKLDIFFR